MHIDDADYYTEYILSHSFSDMVGYQEQAMWHSVLLHSEANAPAKHERSNLSWVWADQDQGQFTGWWLQSPVGYKANSLRKRKLRSVL